jgi:hypothetical protein
MCEMLDPNNEDIIEYSADLVGISFQILTMVDLDI